MPELDAVRVDQLLQTLTGVVRARVRTNGDGTGLSEIHILSDGALPPKQTALYQLLSSKRAHDLPRARSKPLPRKHQSGAANHGSFFSA